MATGLRPARCVEAIIAACRARPADYITDIVDDHDRGCRTCNPDPRPDPEPMPPERPVPALCLWCGWLTDGRHTDPRCPITIAAVEHAVTCRCGWS